VPDNIENNGKILSDEVSSLYAGVQTLKGIRKKMDTRGCPSRLSKKGQHSYINNLGRNCETGNVVCKITAE